MKKFLSTNACLILVTNQKIPIFFIWPVKKLCLKEDVFEGRIIDESVGLKSKIRSMRTIDGRESNTAKGIYIKKGFNEFEDTLSNKKVLRHKIKRTESKQHKLGTYKINKISLLCFHKYGKNRFSHMIINKRRLIKILTKRRDSRR